MRACYAPRRVIHTTQSQKKVSNAKTVTTTSMLVRVVVVVTEILYSSIRWDKKKGSAENYIQTQDKSQFPQSGSPHIRLSSTIWRTSPTFLITKFSLMHQFQDRTRSFIPSTQLLTISFTEYIFVHPVSFVSLFNLHIARLVGLG